MHIAPENDAPTARGHRPASEWMKGIVDCLFARQNPGAMSLSRPAPARRTSDRHCAKLHPRADGAGRFFTVVDLVNRSRPRRAPGARAGSPIISPAWTSSSSTSSAICRSPRPAASCSSTCQPALRAHLDPRHHQSRLRRMAERVRRSKDDHGAARSPYPPLRHRRDRQRELALQKLLSKLKSRNPPRPITLRNPDQLCLIGRSPSCSSQIRTGSLLRENTGLDSGAFASAHARLRRGAQDPR